MMNTLDKVNWYWTFLLLLTLALISLFLPLIVPTAVCNTPAYYLSAHVDYATTKCFYSGKHSTLNHDPNKRDQNTQYSTNSFSALSWAPCILAIMAFATKIPYLLWCQLRPWLSINIDAIVSEIQQHRQKATEERQELLQVTVQTLANVLRQKENSLMILLLRKALTLIVTAFILIGVILTEPFFYMYIGESADDATELGMLRFQSNCSYSEYREKKYTQVSISCIYPANIMLQKMLILLTVYFSVLFLMNLCDLITWMAMFLIPQVRDRRLAQYINVLESTSIYRTSCRTLDRRFATFLGFDGFLLLMTIKERLGELAWAEFSILLWHKYQDAVEGDVFNNAVLPRVESVSPCDLKYGSEVFNEKGCGIELSSDNIELNMLNNPRVCEADSVTNTNPAEPII